jgi:hypothetical protein
LELQLWNNFTQFFQTWQWTKYEGEHILKLINEVFTNKIINMSLQKKSNMVIQLSTISSSIFPAGSLHFVWGFAKEFLRCCSRPPGPPGPRGGGLNQFRAGHSGHVQTDPMNKSHSVEGLYYCI